MNAGAAGRFGGTVHQSGRAFRSEIEEAKSETTRVLTPYNGDLSKFTEFLSTSTADEIMQAVIEYFSSMEDVEVELNPSEEQYKIQADVQKDIGSIDVTVKISAFNEELRAVSLSKNKGNTLDFIQLFNDLNEKCPDLADGIPS
jgi:hypothetical protein